MIRRWREIERWIENGTGEARRSGYPLLPLSELLTPRYESIQAEGSLGDWQPITIKFSGEVLPRERTEPFKGAMFAAYPGDLVFSKIDARNGAVGLIPDSITRAVVTSEYPVFIPNSNKLRPAYLNYLLRAEHFKADLQCKASGTSGRKRVTPAGFLILKVPIPTLDEQDALITNYVAALHRAEKLEQDAETIEQAGWQAFEKALGVAPPPSLPNLPVFVARFKDVERWSHDGMLRAVTVSNTVEPSASLIALGDVLLEVKHGCSKGPSKKTTSLRVLKISAVTKGRLDISEHKFITDEPALRIQFDLKEGDILMCRTNGTLAYVGMSALVESDIEDIIYPDKVIRVRPDRTRINSHFLWWLLQLPAIRNQIETAARTAVGNFAIGGKDIKKLKIPLPIINEQAALVEMLNNALKEAQTNRTEAVTLCQTAWAVFESALFIDREAVQP